MLPHSNHRAYRALAARRAAKGFTVVELMITILVAAVLVTLALPNFNSVMNSGRVNGQANEFVATLQLARMEAIRRNARVVVCPSTTGTSCAGAGANWTGWLAFIDDGGYSQTGTVTGTAGDGNRDPTETILRAGLVPSNVTVTTSNNISTNSSGGAITFNSDGLARDKTGVLLNGRIGVCVATGTPPQNARNVMINSGSRIAVERVTNATCAVPSDSNT